MVCNLAVTTRTILDLVVIYRPPPSQKNGLKTNIFLEEWSVFISKLATSVNELMVVGDFNLHVDVTDDSASKRYLSILDSVGFVQHVKEPTHHSGHTLELVITRESCDTTSVISIQDPCICDNAGNLKKGHYAVTCYTSYVKPHEKHKKLTYRKYVNINMEIFRQDIKNSSIFGSKADKMNLNDMVASYKNELKTLIDKHAPMQSKTISLHPNSPWYNQKLHEAKHIRRNLERRWRSTKLEVHHRAYREQCCLMTRLINDTKRDYYSRQIAENGSDQKNLFKKTKHLLGRTRTEMPDEISDQV